MSKEMRARLHLSEQVEAYLREQAEQHRHSLNDEIVAIVEEAMDNRPCIISIGLPIWTEKEEVQKTLEHLRLMFGWIEMERREKQDELAFLCAAPKNGLSYDEAFILLSRRYFEIGWIYADSVKVRKSIQVEDSDSDSDSER